MGAYIDRGHHRARVRDFRLCNDEHLDVVHGASRGLYFGAMVASVAFSGVYGALASFALVPLGAIYGSASVHREIGSGSWEGQGGAVVAGERFAEVEGVVTRDVLLDVAEGLFPLMLMR